MVYSSGQWLLLVLNVIPVVVNGCHAVVLNGSQWFAMVINDSQRLPVFSMVTSGSQWFPCNGSQLDNSTI